MSNKPTSNGPWLVNTSRAAECLGVPYSSFRDIALRGEVPIVRIPGCRRMYFDVRDLSRAVEQWKETSA